MANQVCFCPQQPPEGAVGNTSSVLRPRVVSFKQILSPKIFPALSEAAQCPGLEWKFYIRQQVVDTFDELTDRMALCGMPEILGREMYIYLRAGDQSVSQ